jgi:hypothetical protein
MNRRLPPHVAAYPGSVLIHGGIGRVAALVQRLQASDTTPATLEALHSAVVELCCDYGWRDAGSSSVSSRASAALTDLRGS